MEYLSTALACAVFISLAALLAPARESVRRACLSAFSVVFLLALIPKDMDLSFEGLLFAPVDTEYEAGEDYRETWREGIEEGLLYDLCASFSLEKDHIAIESRVSHTENEVRIDYLSVTLTGKNVYADATGMVRYIEKNYGCASEIHLKGD